MTQERIFSCLAGEKTITISGKLKRIYSVVDLNDSYYNYVELRISFNNNLLVFKFERSEAMTIRYTVTFNNTQIDQLVFHFLENVYAETDISFNDNIKVWLFNPNFPDEIRRTYDISVPAGNITIILVRSHTDESYCSDFIIEYEPIHHPLVSILMIGVLIGALGSILSSMRRIIE